MDSSLVVSGESEAKNFNTVRRSTRERKKPSRWMGGTALLIASDDTLASYADAVSSPDFERWKKIVKNEYQSFM